MAGVLVNISDSIIPIFISKSIDAADKHLPNAESIIYWALMWTLMIAFVRTATYIGCRFVIIGTSRYIGLDLRNRIYAKLMILSDRFFTSMSTGEIMNRASSDVQAVMMLFGMGGNNLPNAILRTILGTGLMLSMSWRLSIPVLAFVPFIFLVEWQFGRRIHKVWKSIQDYFDSVSASIQENLSGARTVKSYAQEEAENKKFAGLMREYIAKVRPMNKLDALFFPIINIAAWLPILIVLWYGGSLYMNKLITIGELSAFVAYVGMLIWPLISLGWIVNLAQRSNASLKRILDILEAVPDITSPQNPYAPPQVDGKIEFDNVTLSYGTKTPALQDVNLTIEKGQVLGIVGPVGSGKSTLGKLLLRVWDPETGSVCIDGVNLKNWDLATLRRSVGYVPQDSFLFSTTLAENIAYAKPDASMDEVVRVAEMVQIKDEIDKFPNGFETMVGERGVTLSGGQRQRVAIARALLLNPPMLLFDDPLSAVDTSTEDAIIETIAPIIKGHTVVIIAHRVSAMRLADRIIVLDRGKVVEDGSHEQLMQQSGYYAKLVEHQRLASEIGEDISDSKHNKTEEECYHGKEVFDA